MRLLRHSTALIAGLLMSASVMAADSYNDYHQMSRATLPWSVICHRPSAAAGCDAGWRWCLPVSLPFSAMGGNVGEAGHELVFRPAEETFVRCLGCSRAGYGRKQQDEAR
ncbi:multidrug transporter [Halopseudomonas pachastrellae]|nr:multidrug transporter [Halopseudomonas pachastrellae]